jgi:hypothetical protein
MEFFFMENQLRAGIIKRLEKLQKKNDILMTCFAVMGVVFQIIASELYMMPYEDYPSNWVSSE